MPSLFKVQILCIGSGVWGEGLYRSSEWPVEGSVLNIPALAGQLSWLEHRLVHQRVAGLTPGRGVYEECGATHLHCSLSKKKKKNQ